MLCAPSTKHMINTQRRLVNAIIHVAHIVPYSQLCSTFCSWCQNCARFFFPTLLTLFLLHLIRSFSVCTTYTHCVAIVVIVVDEQALCTQECNHKHAPTTVSFLYTLVSQSVASPFHTLHLCVCACSLSRRSAWCTGRSCLSLPRCPHRPPTVSRRRRTALLLRTTPAAPPLSHAVFARQPHRSSRPPAAAPYGRCGKCGYAE